MNDWQKEKTKMCEKPLSNVYYYKRQTKKQVKYTKLDFSIVTENYYLFALY